MKIVHITENYIPGWGYQENLLPRYQRKSGHEVVVVADNDHLGYIKNETLANEIRGRGLEYEQDDIKVYKIKTYFNTSSTSFICRGLYRILENEKPDMIFHHNINTSTLLSAIRYKYHHPEVILYADNHVDWINETNNPLWHLFYYDMLIPLFVMSLGRKVDYYIGVSPLRCKYLHKIFRVPTRKIRFLPIGCDTEQASLVSSSKQELRAKYLITKDAFVVACGGKIDRSKGVLELINACSIIKQSGVDARLILFGKVDKQIQQIVSDCEWINAFGWCDRVQTMELLKMADVACWPLLHTTLIEDAVAVGTPLVVKMSDNVIHYSRYEAGVFLRKGDEIEIAEALHEVRNNIDTFIANTALARDAYSYLRLSQKLDKEEFYDIEW